MGTGKDKKKKKNPPKLLSQPDTSEQLIVPLEDGEGQHLPGAVCLNDVSTGRSEGLYPDSPERKIGTIVIGYCQNNHPSPTYHDALVLISSLDETGMGFAVQKGWGANSHEAWMRDTQIVLSDGSLLFPFTGDDYDEGFEQGHYRKCQPDVDLEECIKPLLGDESYVTCKTHVDYRTVSVKVFSTRGLVRDAQQAAVSANHPSWKARTCVEGGNILVARKANDEPGAIIGETSLIQSLLVLEVQRLFAPETVKEREELLRGSVGADPRLRERLQSAVRPTSDHTSALFLAVLGAPSVKGLVVDKQHVLRYLAKLDITKDYIAADSGLPRESLTFVEQPAFHLDMAMAVGPGGHILVQSSRQVDRGLEPGARGFAPFVGGHRRGHGSALRRHADARRGVPPSGDQHARANGCGGRAHLRSAPGRRVHPREGGGRVRRALRQEDDVR
ncbi:MAG: hypothetical protein QM820_39505 [Minicystis sp.]